MFESNKKMRFVKLILGKNIQKPRTRKTLRFYVDLDGSTTIGTTQLEKKY